jgi:predicted DNA-binding ribbon-helix-helix protein
MTGELAKSISILPIAITTDMDGNVLSAESAAKIVNNQAIRDLRNKILALEQADKPNEAKIKELKDKIKELEKATTVPLEPIPDATLAEYGVVMKAPVLPNNLKPEALGKEAVQPELTEEQIKAEIKKLKTRITNLNKKIAALPNGGMITAGDALVLSPEYEQLKLKKEQAEKELAKLEGTSEKKDESEDKIKGEIDGLRGGTSIKEVFPQPETVTSAEFKTILEGMRNSKTLEELEKAYNDAIVAVIGESDMTFSDLVNNVYEIRKMALSTNLSQENIAVGEYLISKKPIFDGPANQVVVVKEVKEDGKIVLNQVEDVVNGKPRKKTVTARQLEADFTKTTDEALSQEEEVMETTEEEKEKSTVSKSSIKDFADNPELINQAKQNAAISKKDRLAALKNKSKDDNINNCKPK